MKNFKLIIVFFIFSIASAFSQTKFDLNAPVPVDPNVRIGKLSNGMTYYIRKNLKPEKRCEMNIVVKVGSLMEDDDQQGLAHFNEHMGFNGLKSFKGNDMIKYFESKGIIFGREINAYTSFDQTVYQITAPTDSLDVFNKAFDVIGEWAHYMLFDSTEVEKERGVIVEEWRLGQGADERMQKIYWPILFKDSKYGVRNPIGQKEIIETFKQSTLKRFYNDWYRPELMAVVFVGDIDVDKMEAKIKEQYSKIPTVSNPRPLVECPVPDHDKPYVVRVQDKEATNVAIQIYYLHPAQTTKTVADYRRDIIQGFVNQMLNSRLDEYTQKENPPFLYAGSYYGSLVKTKDNFISYIYVKDDGIERGLEVVAMENEKARRYGFSQSELDRQKESVLRQLESALAEKDKTKSNRFLNQYIYNFLDNNPIPGIENQYALYKQLLPTITIEEVNAVIGKFITDGKNMVVVVTAPEKETVKMPSENRILEIINKVKDSKIDKYVDEVTDKPFLANKPTGSKVIEEKINKELGITEWKLANGVRVFLKPTDFKNDEIIVSGFSWGGNSLYENKDYMSASYAATIVDNGGIGEMNSIMLQKFMQNKRFGLTPFISEKSEGLTGNCSPKDIETELQYLYMFFTAPRKDETAFKAFLETQKSWIANRSSDPMTAFYDTITVVLKQHHFRSRPETVEILSEINLDRAFDIYKDRFADASDFTFNFVGNFKVEEIKPLIETYLGGLPSINRKETWKDVGIKYINGKVEKNIYKGVDKKSQVLLVLQGDEEWTLKSRTQYSAMIQALSIKVEEVIREEKSGTYGIGVYGYPILLPKGKYYTQVYFGCNPDRAEELVKSVIDVINDVKANGLADEYLKKVKAQTNRTKETQIKENNYWNEIITAYVRDGDNFQENINKNKIVDEMTSDDIKKLVIKYFDFVNYDKFILLPEDMKK